MLEFPSAAGLTDYRQETYGDDFFADIHGVTNALDNVMASEGICMNDVLEC